MIICKHAWSAWIICPQDCMTLCESQRHISQVNLVLIGYFIMFDLAHKELGPRWEKDYSSWFTFTVRSGSKVIEYLSTIYRVDIESHISFWARVFQCILIVCLLRNPSWYYILKSENFTYLEVLELIIVWDLNFPDATTSIFFTWNDGPIDPIHHLLQLILKVN